MWKGQVDVVVVDVNVVKPLERDIQLRVSCIFLLPVTINNKKILKTCGHDGKMEVCAKPTK